MNLFGFIITVALFLIGVAIGYVLGIWYAVVNRKEIIDKAVKAKMEEKE